MYIWRFTIEKIPKNWYNIVMENTIENIGTIEISVKEYEQLKASEEALRQRVGLLEEALRLARKQRFGSSSEKISSETKAELIYLFDEAETNLAIEDIIAEEQETKVAAHTRKKKTYLLQDKLPENVEVEVITHKLSEADRNCPKCGTLMQEIGEEIRRELVIVPAKVKVLEHHIYSYACQNCQKTDIATPIIRAEKEPALIPGGFATPEAVAHVMTQKFLMASPLYRQEQEWKSQGIELSRQTMSNWLLKSVEIYLNPLYQRLHENLISLDLLHADETPIQVLKELDRSPKSKSYMWLYRTGSDAEHPIVLYEYQASRGNECPKKFLEGFKGYLQTDGHNAYHKLCSNVPDIINVGCWAHVRRKFEEARNALPKGKSPEMSASVKALGIFTRLAKIEKQLAKVSCRERYLKRLEEEKPILDELFAWVKTLNAAPNSSLGKAITYLNNQKPYLLNYLKDGRLEISNNRAERSIKPFVIGRKNFLFANTPRGAQGSAVIYSIIETAKENHLEPFKYLVYVLSTAKKLDLTDPKNVDLLLPENAPAECSVHFRG